MTHQSEQQLEKTLINQLERLGFSAIGGSAAGGESVAIADGDAFIALSSWWERVVAKGVAFSNFTVTPMNEKLNSITSCRVRRMFDGLSLSLEFGRSAISPGSFGLPPIF